MGAGREPFASGGAAAGAVAVAAGGKARTMQADSRLDTSFERTSMPPRRAIATTAFAWPMSMPMQDMVVSYRLRAGR